MVDFNFTQAIQHIAGAMQGDPLLYEKLGQARQAMQIQLDKMKMDAEAFDLEKKKNLLAIKQGEMAMNDQKLIKQLISPETSESPPTDFSGQAGAEPTGGMKIDPHEFLRRGGSIEGADKVASFLGKIKKSQPSEEWASGGQGAFLYEKGTGKTKPTGITKPDKEEITTITGPDGNSYTVLKSDLVKFLSSQKKASPGEGDISESNIEFPEEKKPNPVFGFPHIKGKSPKADKEEKYDFIENPETGEQRKLKSSEPIPPGWRKAGGTMKVDVSGIEKGTKKEIETRLLDATDAMDKIQDVASNFKDEYLTYAGDFKHWASVKGDKANVLTDSQKKWLDEYTSWFATSQENLLRFRKIITGVAGGEKEFDEIAKAFPDPQKNSPTEYRSKLRQSAKIGLKLMKRYQMFLNFGVKNPSKEQLSSIPLSQIEVSEDEINKILSPKSSKSATPSGGNLPSIEDFILQERGKK